MLKNTSTTQSFVLIEFTSCGLFILRNGLPNRPKHKASKIVDLPAPLLPMIKVFGDLIKSIYVKLAPVERKFFQRTFSNIIMPVLGSTPQHIILSLQFLACHYQCVLQQYHQQIY